VTSATTSGSCATTFIGRKASVAFVLPADVQSWAGVLTYVVLVDGSIVWRPDSSLCDPVAPGLNSLGRGRERLFSYCSELGPRDAGRYWGGGPPDDNLSSQRHSVEVVASLPGTKVRFSARGEIDLRCGP
jgi:hypothetical protein